MMKRYSPVIFILLTCMLCTVMSSAQNERKRYNLNLPENDSIKNMYLDGRRTFLEERLHQPFPSLGYREAIDHTPYDFDGTGRCRIIMFGIANGMGCRIELPCFMDLSNDRRYAAIDFLYISYNDSATIMKEITSQYKGSHERVKMFTVSRDYFLYTDKPLLAYGFPTIHFIDDKGWVKAIMLGAHRKATPKETAQLLKTEWAACLDSLSCY